MSRSAASRPGAALRILSDADARAFRRLRLAGLEEYPDAFGESAAEFRRTSIDATAARLRASSGEQFVIGAFVGVRLVGVAGFFRHTGRKRRHSGLIWGVYVDAAFRRRGIARAMLEALVARAAAVKGLRQISLSVTMHRRAARALYDALGFEVFGIEKRSLCVDGVFVDEEHRMLDLKRRT